MHFFPFLFLSCLMMLHRREREMHFSFFLSLFHATNLLLWSPSFKGNNGFCLKVGHSSMSCPLQKDERKKEESFFFFFFHSPPFGCLVKDTFFFFSCLHSWSCRRGNNNNRHTTKSEKGINPLLLLSFPTALGSMVRQIKPLLAR